MTIEPTLRLIARFFVLGSLALGHWVKNIAIYLRLLSGSTCFSRVLQIGAL